MLNQIFALVDFEKVEDYVYDLYGADVLILSPMVLESSIFPFRFIKIKLVVACDKTGEEEIIEQCTGHQQMEVLKLQAVRLYQLLTIIYF